MIFRISEIYWPERAKEDLPEDAIAEINYELAKDELPSSEDYVKIDKLLRGWLKKTFGAEPVTFDWSPDEDASEPAPVHQKPKKKKRPGKYDRLLDGLRRLDVMMKAAALYNKEHPEEAPARKEPKKEVPEEKARDLKELATEALSAAETIPNLTGFNPACLYHSEAEFNYAHDQALKKTKRFLTRLYKELSKTAK